MALRESVGDFFPDDGAKFAVGLEFYLSVADATEIEVWAIADVTLVFIRPLDEAVVAVLGFHFEPLVEGFCFGNRIGNLTLLVSLGIVTFGSGEGDDVRGVGVLELAVGAFLAIKLEARTAEIGEELADLAGHEGELAGRGVYVATRP